MNAIAVLVTVCGSADNGTENVRVEIGRHCQVILTAKRLKVRSTYAIGHFNIDKVANIGRRLFALIPKNATVNRFASATVYASDLI